MSAHDSHVPIPEGYDGTAGLPFVFCQTGDEYVTFHGRETSEAAAVKAIHEALRVYSAGRPGKLYWRSKPEMRHDFNGWCWYFRAVISDKPEQCLTYEGARAQWRREMSYTESRL